MNVSVSINKRKNNTSSIGLMIAIASWAIMFMTLVWGYLFYRMKAGVWIDGYLTKDLWNLALINTVFLIISSMFYRQVRLRFFSLWFGFFFLVGQWQLWHLALNNGFNWQGSIVGSFFFMLTGFHALHILGGLAAIAYVSFLPQERLTTTLIKGVGYFWDFLLIVWVTLFVVIFILK